MDKNAQKLLAFGSALFLLGLLSGFIIPLVQNPRMGLSSHLEGVMNGMFLILIGLAWHRLKLSNCSRSVTFWLLLYGTYANWIFVQVAAIFGTSEITPIAGAGYKGQPWQETVVSAGLTSVGLTMLIAVLMLVWGFFKGTQGKK